MQMVVLLLEEHIRNCQDHEGANQVNPMHEDQRAVEILSKGGRAPDEAEGDEQLEAHVHQRDDYMTETELVGHQLK